MGVCSQELSSVHASPIYNPFPVEELLAKADIEEPQCTVCQDAIKKTDVMTTLACQHMFHKECVEPWLNLNNSCPNCRTVVKESPSIQNLNDTANYSDAESDARVSSSQKAVYTVYTIRPVAAHKFYRIQNHSCSYSDLFSDNTFDIYPPLPSRTTIILIRNAPAV